MFRIWYWAAIDRESDGRFIASIPDLGDLAAFGENEKEAVAHVAELAADHVRALVEAGQPAPQARPAAELPTAIRLQRGEPISHSCESRTSSGIHGFKQF